MPLLDHFHEPLRPRRHWTSFHAALSTYIASDLNRRLPEDYVAEGGAKFGIEIDVATFRERSPTPSVDGGWAPPAPVMTMPFTTIGDVVEVQVMNFSGGPNLVGAIEIVSPANKDRDASRNSFVNKYAGYLQEGVGLIIIDFVTERTANLHNLLTERVGAGASPWEADLYAAAYHPIQEDVKDVYGAQTNEGKKWLEIWPHELKLGEPLPTLPLCLKGGLCLPLELEAIYMHTCKELRISSNGR
jgi:hypothetical protein